MQLARVLGNVVCTRKNDRLDGVPLLIVQPIRQDGSDVGRALVATDATGAGPGERVFYVRGSEATFPFHPRVVPTDASIVGIVDRYDAE